MRLLLASLLAGLMVVFLGCSGPESSYQDRKAPAEEVDPSETLEMMGPQPGPNQTEQATDPTGGGQASESAP